MKALKILLLLVLSLIVSSSENLKYLESEFLADTLGPDCIQAGGRCSSTNPCCDGLTCSEFKICRN